MQLFEDADRDFLLYRWLRVGDLLTLKRFEGQSPDVFQGFFDLAGKIAQAEFQPAYKPSDRDEPTLDPDGTVRVHPAIAAAVRSYLDAGLHLATVEADHGGLQFPMTVATAAMAEMMAANISASGFPMLSIGNARVLTDHGTPAQIDAFARPQHEGRALGTMCLSEPDVGSSLGDITTRAVADGDDALGPRYRLFGRKMWISSGGQDITPTTVHLVLAKIADDAGRLPPGTGGISLFIVPSRLPEGHPQAGQANDVTVAGLNHKMGYRGIPNCALNFGEGRARPEGAEGALGWLLGAPGQGLAIMFQMMNEARINVGLGAAALAGRGYLLSRAYAAERVQGRPLDDKTAPAPVPILRHPDVRRMILAQKAITAGALALCLYASDLVDRARWLPDAAARTRAAALLDLLTPVVKTWSSEQGLVANHHAIQIHGGYGYTRDFDVEQIYRDNRLNPIHEGTTGIQGLDLLGRKLFADRFRAAALLHEEIAATAARADRHPALADMAGELRAAADSVLGLLRQAAEGDPLAALAHATPVLHGVGHLCVAWLLLDIAAAAEDGRGGDVPGDLADEKLWTCRYFFAFDLPAVAALLAPLASATDVTRAVPDHAL